MNILCLKSEKISVSNLIMLVVTFVIFQASASHAELKDFSTEDGTCNITDQKDLQDQSESPELAESYTLTGLSIDRRRGSSPPTGTTIPALEPVFCLADVGSKMLVTAINSNYCGWVSSNGLANVGSNSGSIFGSQLPPCGKIEAMSLKDFCSKATKIKNLSSRNRELLLGCDLKTVKESKIKTKFVTDNTTSRKVQFASEQSLAKKKIEVFRIPGDNQPKDYVSVFSLLEIYDVYTAKNDEIYVLLGSGGNQIKGWAKLDSGHVWYSRLSTYFNAKGRKSVFLNKINSNSNAGNVLLADKPSVASFDVDRDFVKFPVLFDMRDEKDAPPQQSPQLQIAFIGKFCKENSGRMCTSNASSSSIADLDAADIVFLVDGTKSMQEYFKIVSNALQSFTKKYVGNQNYRFGVAMYGDFKSSTQRNLGSPLDFKVLLDLKPTYTGNFEGISDAKLFILDPSKDKEEPTHAAIYNAVQSFDWKSGKPHFLIHIADHGDRVGPSVTLFNMMKNQEILYIPIAVKGEVITVASKKFVSDSQKISQSYVTEKGKPLAVPAIVSYGIGKNSPRENITKALVEAANGFSVEDEKGDIIPILKDAAREIFGIPEEDDIEQLAATGFIETVALERQETNWDYFVSLEAIDLGNLKQSAEKVCSSLGKSGTAIKDVEEAVCSLVGTLTGDDIDTAKCVSVLADQSIPLQTKTLIGEGLTDFIRTLQLRDDKQVDRYKKEFCRTHKLIEIMLKGFKLDNPEDGQDLKWNGNYFEPQNPKRFKWEYTDTLGNDVHYVPLSFLPRPQTEN